MSRIVRSAWKIAVDEDTARRRVDHEALRRWLADTVGLAPDRALDLTLLDGSRNNCNWLVSDGDRSWVLRQAGSEGDSISHDLEDEYEVLHVLRDSSVPVPEPVAFCSDPSVASSPFFVMERCEGRVVRSSDDLRELPPTDCRRVSDELIDHLSALHDLDIPGTGERVNRVAESLEDRLATLQRMWVMKRRREDLDAPGIDELFRHLEPTLPSATDLALVHGDYRIDNVMLDERDPGRIAALLDWDRSMLDDPLVDLGYFLAFWGYFEPALEFISPTIWADDGFESPEAMIECYARRSGRDVTEIDWYILFAMLQLILLLEFVFLPSMARVRPSDEVHAARTATRRLTERALDLARASKTTARS